MYNYSYSGRYMSSASGIYQAGTKDCAEKRITMNNQEMMELTTVDKSEFEELVKECTRSGNKKVLKMRVKFPVVSCGSKL